MTERKGFWLSTLCGYQWFTVEELEALERKKGGTMTERKSIEAAIEDMANFYGCESGQCAVCDQARAALLAAIQADKAAFGKRIARIQAGGRDPHIPDADIEEMLEDDE